MDDLTTYVLLAASFFFVAMALGLLVRYRQVSRRINASTDLGYDLWSSLEQRLKKQDERILDMMGRLEVVQSRVVTATAAVGSPAPVGVVALPPIPPPSGEASSKPTNVIERKPVVQQTASYEPQPTQPIEGASQSPGPEGGLDETQLGALRLLAENPRNTRQLTDALSVSREHMARVMKALFELGLVSRDTSSKPFVYRLSDEGKRRLQV